MNGQPPYYQNSIIPIEKPKLRPPWYPFVYISGKLFSKSIHSDTFKLWSTHSNFIITNSYQKTYTKISVCIVHSFESISFFSDGCFCDGKKSEHPVSSMGFPVDFPQTIAWMHNSWMDKRCGQINILFHWNIKSNLSTLWRDTIKRIFTQQ